jgi:hypothetical protein
MAGVYLILGGMVLFAATIAFLDWLTERHDRAAKRKP